MITRFAQVGLAAFLLSGCAATGPLSPPETPGFVPPQWTIAPPPSLPPSQIDYWQQLNDPLLTRYVSQALIENRDLAAAAARIAQAQSGVRIARAAYLPRLDIGASGGRDFGDFAPDDVRVDLGVNASWEADLFGRVSYDVAASRARLSGAGFALADLQRLIIGQVAQATISARAIGNQIEIARESLKIQDENLQIASWRFQAGLVSSLDVEQAKSQRAQTAASIPALERELVATANALSVLLGEPPGKILADLQTIDPIPVPPDNVGYAMPAEVLRNRPDVRRAEASLLADGAQVGLVKSQLLPAVQLTGNLNTGSVGIDGLFDMITGGLVASISQLIFDGGRSRAQIASAEARAQESLALWEQAILRSLEEVESASAALMAARERVVLFDQSAESADNAAILARSQYQAGLIDFSALLIAENQLLSARNAAIASEAERANAFVQLNQALGGGGQSQPGAQMPSPEAERIEE